MYVCVYTYIHTQYSHMNTQKRWTVYLIGRDSVTDGNTLCGPGHRPMPHKEEPMSVDVKTMQGPLKDSWCYYGAIGYGWIWLDMVVI